MAFTPTEEAQLRAVITAFESGKTISEIAASTEVFTTDVLEIVQSAVSKKATIAQIVTLVNSELGIGSMSTKLSGIEAGAQVNIIESVKVNNTVLPISSKSVNITVPTQPSDIGAEPALGFTPEQAGAADSLITALKNGVSTEGDTLKKLYDLIVASFSEVQVGTIAARDAYNITKLPTSVFVLDDGDSKWALYKATTLGVNATYVKLSDPDLLNAVMTASQIKSAYESNADTNAFTDALKAKLDAFTANFTAELKATYDGKISPKPVESVTPYTIGQQVDGGVVFYILQPTDIGYESGKQKCLIAATVDQNSGIQWYANSYVTTNATNIEIGRGLANTDLIVSAQGTSVQYAARLCSDYAGGGYTDWYLGSLDEMMKLSDNKAAAGINDLAGAYWTSSEVSSQYALVVYTVPMSEYNSIQKNQSYAVRAIRTSVLDLGYSLPVDGEVLLASGNDGKEAKGSGIQMSSIISLVNSKEPLLPATPPNPESRFLNGNKQWAEIVLGSGGYASNVYFTNLTSTIVGTYKQTSGTHELTETIASGTCNNNEVLIHTYLFEQPVGITTVDAGVWRFTMNCAINSSVGDSKFKIVQFRRSSTGVETDMFTIYSNTIENTDYQNFIIETVQPSFLVDSLDRFGCRIYATTTTTVNKIISYKVGDGFASYLNTPLALRHPQLRDPNGNPNIQHLTSDQLQIVNTVPLVCSDEKTDLTASTDVPVIRFVFQTAQSFTKIVGELNTAAAGGTFTVVAKKNGVSFLSTNLTFDGGENTTRTAAVPFVFTTPTVSFSVGDYVEIFVTTIGAVTPGKGLKIYLM